MRQVTHHPSDATLMCYAAGSLDHAAGIVVRHHLDLCPICAETVRLGEIVAVELISTETGGPLRRGALDELMARIERPFLPDPEPSPLNLAPELMQWVGPGIRFRRLYQHKNFGLQLVWLAPGAQAPIHTHNGLELMLVLRGAFADDRGEYGMGDVCEADDEVWHAPRTVSAQPCVCLTSLEGDLRYRSLLHRLRRTVLGL